jgi:hypothetical protein
MSYDYSAFGLSLGSNWPLPGLMARQDSSPIDIAIWLQTEPVVGGGQTEAWYRSDPDVERASRLWVWSLSGGRYFQLVYGDGTQFYVNGRGSEIWATWPDASTIEDTATYLLGPILAFALRLRGVLCLHASVVGLEKRAIALVGPAQSGKSTAAAAFAQLGATVLTDDVAALVEFGGQVYAHPAYPQLRLWPDSVSLLYGSAAALPRLTPNWDKRMLDLTNRPYRFQPLALPLAAIYVLGPRSAGGRARVDILRGRGKLRVLLGNTHVGYLLNEEMRAAEFASLARLVSRVPVRLVTPPCEPSALSDLCSRIIEDCEALACTASPTTAR